MANCNDYISADDLKTGKQAILHIEHVAKSRDAAGNPALEVTDTIRGESVTNKTLDGLENLYNQAISQVGYITLKSFQTGAPLPNNELTLPNQVLQDETNGEYYRWDGTFPKSVPPGSTPDSTGGVGSGAWVSVGDASLRGDLASPSGSSLSGHSNGLSVAENLNNLLAKAQFVTPEQFYSNHPGETDWAIMINESYAYARANNKSVLLANDYHVKSPIIHLDGLNVVCTGRIIADPSGVYSYKTALGNTENAAYVITSEDGVFNNAKSSSIIGTLTLTHTADRESTGYTDPHINATGVVITDMANVYISNIQTFGFLDGGIDVGGISGNGFEIVIDKSLSWIYAWEDSDKIGFRCNVTDSTFKDVVTVAYGIGIHNVKGGGNVYINPHPWGYPLTETNAYPNRQCKINFVLTGGGSTFIRPYADTITKIDSTQPSSRYNGGIGFYINNWRNKIIAAEAAIHNDEISNGLSLVYLVGNVARNEIEFVNINNISKLINERVSYDSDYQNALFTNIIRVPEYNAGNLSNLTGSISFDGTGITSSGTYNLRRSGEYIDILLTINVSSISNPSGALSITLPRGLICRFGPSSEPSQTSCFGNINSNNIGVIAVLNGSNINFYYKTANGSRTLINAAGVSIGTLELFLRGKISN